MTPENRKVCVGTRFFAIADSKSGGDHIEAAFNRVDDDSGFGVETEIGGSRPPHYHKIVSCLRIRLYSGFIWAAPLPGNEALLQDWDLGYGPIH